MSVICGVGMEIHLRESHYYSEQMNLDKKKLPILIRNCWFGLNYLLRKRISRFPITTAQYTVLRCICENPSETYSQKELAQLIGTNENNLSSLISRLNNKKFIVLANSGNDRRVNSIIPSAKGKKIYEETNKIACDLISKISIVLNENENFRLSEYLKKFNGNLSLYKSKKIP